MLLILLGFLAGLVLLIKGADEMVSSGAWTAVEKNSAMTSTKPTASPNITARSVPTLEMKGARTWIGWTQEVT